MILRSAIFLLYILLIVSCVKSSDPPDSDPDILTIGTFNIAWLGDGINDNITRSSDDYKRIADIIKQTGCDIIGLQEIENIDAIKILLKHLEGYSFYLGKQGGKQNLGIIYKNIIQIIKHFEYSPLIVAENKTRPGFVVEAKKENFDFIMMIVHLKSTSRYDDTPEKKQLSYDLRRMQTEVISDWVDSVLSSGSEKDIMIVGDFNDYPSKTDNATLTTIIENPDLTFLTDDLMSCKYPNLRSIDHIVTSTQAKERFVKGSQRMLDIYYSLPDSEAEKVSDHCPVMVVFETKSEDND